MVTLLELEEDGRQLREEARLKGFVPSVIEKARILIQKAGDKFTENNEVIANNSAHARVELLRKENSALTKIINQWEKLANL